ncbi:hypothetical protein ABZY81_35010 [Streptomyces sp. NPDC006514]
MRNLLAGPAALAAVLLVAPAPGARRPAGAVHREVRQRRHRDA